MPLGRLRHRPELLRLGPLRPDWPGQDPISRLTHGRGTLKPGGEATVIPSTVSRDPGAIRFCPMGAVRWCVRWGLSDGDSLK